jgi:uncharacterized protein (TIRG00374 family)
VIVAVRLGDAQEFARLARRVRPIWLITAAVLQAGTYACDAQIWRRVLLRCGHAQPFARLLRLSIARLFVSQAVPSGGLSGDFVVVCALERHGVPMDALMTALVGDLYAFYAAFALFAGASAAVFFAEGQLRGPILGIAVPFAVIAIAVPATIALLLRAGSSTRAGRRLRIRPLRRVLEAFGSARRDLLLDPRLFGELAALQVATFALDACTLLVMLVALGHPASVLQAVAAFTLASAAELVGPMPGGLGAFEGGCVVGLHAFGVPIETALVATLLLRGFTFWLPMIPGALIARGAATARRAPG